MNEKDGIWSAFQQWREGHDEALDLLLLRIQPLVEQRVRPRLGQQLRHRQDTGDVVQEVLEGFFKALRRRKVELVDERHLFHFLWMLVDHKIGDICDRDLSAKRNVDREEQVAEIADIPTVSGKGPITIAEESEAHVIFLYAMQLLTPEERALLEMRYWDHRAFAEIALTLGIREEAAQMRHKRAMVRLTNVISDLMDSRTA